jgi:hypothetical protein
MISTNTTILAFSFTFFSFVSIILHQFTAISAAQILFLNALFPVAVSFLIICRWHIPVVLRSIRNNESIQLFISYIVHTLRHWTLIVNAPIRGVAILQTAGLYISAPAAGPPSTVYCHCLSHSVGLAQELILSNCQLTDTKKPVQPICWACYNWNCKPGTSSSPHFYVMKLNCAYIM